MHKTGSYDKLRKFLSYYGPFKALLTADLFCSAVFAALGLILPLCVRYITNDILIAGAAATVQGAAGAPHGAAPDVLPDILRAGAVMIAIIFAMAGARIFYDYKGHDMGAKIERGLREELFAHYQELPFSFFDEKNTGELMSRLTNDLYTLSEVYHHVPEAILIHGIQAIGTIAILIVIDWKLALVVFSILPPMAVYIIVFYNRLKKSYKENNKSIAEINGVVQESLSGIRIVKTFANESAEIDKFASVNARFYINKSGIYKSEALFYSIVENFFTPLITVAIAVAGGIWISGGTLGIANLLMFIMYAAYLTGPIPGLAGVLPFYQQGFTGYNRFREIMDTEPSIRDIPGALEIGPPEGRVEFRDVTFRYNEEHEYVLRNIDLDVKPGETVAIIGRSGIGKSTICSLIPRFYEVSGGAVLIDGADVRGITQQSLRRQIGIVRQETFLFSGTVMENILYGKPGASEAEAIEAAKKANAHDYITGLPHGYGTEIGQRGVKLSGGQQQRLSIARVFLKDPPIIIFDEATSALDYDSEKEVMRSLRALANGRTTFIIAHRLSTVKNADRIIVLGDEGIIEQGTHEQLIGQGGEYARLYGAGGLLA